MVRPTKLTKQLQQQIGENVALGLNYALAAAASGITYQTFNDWMNKEKSQNLKNISNSINTSRNATLKGLESV